MKITGQSRIFISYSHGGNGQAWKAAIVRALHVFELHHLLDVWEDGKIRVSAFWDDDITKAMNSAQLAVVLLTPEAFKSDYIVNREFPVLSGRQKQDQLPVVPVICEPCDWKAHEWIRATQAPNASNPLSELAPPLIERAFRALATEVAEKLSHVALTGISVSHTSLEPAQVYLDRFPLTRGAGLYHEKLIGREQELALLDLAFAQPHTAIVSLVAWGGVGKTMLVQHWLRRLQREGWFGARRVYAWSFYSQGTKEDRQASEDTFLTHALEWFGVQCEPTLSPWDKGRLLADAVARERTLLILDGIEPLQYPPGPMGGQLRAPGVQSLLKHLARKANATHSPLSTPKSDFRCLCLVTTREPLADLADFHRREGSPWGSVLRVDLGNLIEEAGAALLHNAGAKRAGAAEIKADDTELFAASRDVDGHALTLNLLGRFLARAHDGDIRRRDLVKFEEADRKEQGGTTFRMLAAFENWFSKSGEFGARQLAVLRMLGLFDRPADTGCVAALQNPPVIAGLTDPLFHLTVGSPDFGEGLQPLQQEDWNTVTSFLSDFGLVVIQAGTDNGEIQLDCHPLIREHFSKRLQVPLSDPWSVANRRIAEHLLSEVSQDLPDLRNPASQRDFELLFRAAKHYCSAGDFSSALYELYRRRISRGDWGYATRTYGLFSAEMALLASFFEQPWDASSCQLTGKADQLLVFRCAGFGLAALGRLLEGVPLLRNALTIADGIGDSHEAAMVARNLANCLISAGELADASAVLEDNRRHADVSDDTFMPVGFRCSLAYARLLENGPIASVASLFDEAWECNSRRDQNASTPELPNFQYFIFLIARGDEHVVVSRLDAIEGSMSSETLSCFGIALFALARIMASSAAGNWDVAEALLNSRRRVIWQAGRRDLIAQWHLSRAETALRRLANQADEPQFAAPAKASLEEAIEISRGDGFVPLRAEGLRLRAWLSFLQGKPAAARADLDEALDIAKRAPMRLHMADIRLYRARLFFREKPYPWISPEDDLAAAAKLIKDCAYHRRDEELADAKRVILGAET